jgi:tetratricopeptide (TPR) repeat protein
VRTTTGSAPARGLTPDDAVAHLLRHLHDASALRTNPIARTYFVAADGNKPIPTQERAHALRRIQELVAVAVDKLLSHEKGDERAAIHASRQHAIVRRCDLQRESHAAVAADLGISRRQFYRERKRACARLADYLERTRSYDAVSCENEFDLHWDIASGFCAAGKYDSAVLMMEGLAAAGEAPQRIRAYAGLVPMLGEVGRIGDAKTAVAAAREVYAACRMSAAESVLARAEIETAAARVAWLTGDLKAAVARHEWILGHLRSAPPLATGRALELRAVSQMRLGMLKRDFGDARGSLQSLVLASRTLGSFARPAPLLQAEFLANLSLSFMVSPGGLEKSAACMAEYLSYSREHHLMCDTADALANLATLHLQWGDVAQARRFARSSLKLAPAVCSDQQLVYITINAAVAEATESPRSALNLIAQARERTAGGSFAWALLEVAAAEALLAGQFYDRARETATGAARMMWEMGAVRYAGSALRIAAEAEEHLGNRAKALAFIHEALRALETSGHASSLASAYACSARLTANTVHAANARDLLKNLQRPHTAIVT